jgi:hypothetical protein
MNCERHGRRWSHLRVRTIAWAAVTVTAATLVVPLTGPLAGAVPLAYSGSRIPAHAVRAGTLRSGDEPQRAATPAAPVTLLRANGISNVAVTLSWTNPLATNFAGVVIRRSVGTIAPTTAKGGTAIATLSRPAHLFTDNGLAASTTYTFAVFARTTSSTFAAAAVVRLTTAPGPVTRLKVTKATASTVSLRWKDPSSAGFAGVLIRRATGKMAPGSASRGQLVARLGASAKAYTDSDLSPGTTYSYAVFSYNATSENSTAADAGARTAGATVTSIDACGTTDTISTTRTWSPARATSYDVDCALTIASGVKLTVDPGTVLKLSGMLLVGSGATLLAGGKGAPVIFTSYRDGDVGGAVAGQQPPQNGALLTFMWVARAADH